MFAIFQPYLDRKTAFSFRTEDPGIDREPS
jgi:hypothetical protein